MSIKKYAYLMLKPMMFICSAVKRKKNKVVFISFNGASYNDNPKAISEKLHEVSPDTEIVWVFNKPDEKKMEIPSYVRCVANRHRILIKELSDAKVWVNNFLFSPLLYKAKNQVYIQTWHGDRGFKKILFDCVGKYKKFDKLFEQKSCDYIISGSKHGERFIRSAFRYNGEILSYGCPRNDTLINFEDSDVTNIKKSLCISENKKILLYAPTLRERIVTENKFQDMRGINLRETLKVLEEKFGSEWICFVRAHQNGSDIGGIEYDDKIIDMSKHPDMLDLLLITDFLVTDYSSSYGDYVLLNRPAVLFQDDRKEYVGKEREFYFNIDDTPFVIAENQQELNEAIMKFDDEFTKKNCKDILAFYGSYETGCATRKVVDIIMKALSETKKRK